MKRHDVPFQVCFLAEWLLIVAARLFAYERFAVDIVCVNLQLFGRKEDDLGRAAPPGTLGGEGI